MKIVVLSPHRDDAAFSLGLSVAAWVAAGHKVAVVNVCTRSEWAPFSDADSVHENDRMSFVSALRHREDEAWRRRVGNAMILVDLNLKDAPLRMHCSREEAQVVQVNVNDKTIAKVQKAVEALKAGAVAIPMGLDADVDHRTVLAAAEKLAGTLPCCFYEELPAALSLDVDAAARELSARVGVELMAAFAGGGEDAVKRKMRVAVGYDSQINDATAEAIAEFATRCGGRERVWGNAAWVAAGLGVAE
ncbi:MAG: PIG-L family deacetylase [Acidobacteriota bacterium]